MLLTVGQAAKATGKSKPTITRALRKGLITYAKSELDGSYQIEASELFRVFPALPSASNDTAQVTRSDPANETGVLQVEVKLLREMLDAERNAMADLKEDRDHWRQQAERLLLAAPVAQEAPKRRWWHFGRAND